MRKGKFGKISEKMQASIVEYLDKTAPAAGSMPGIKIVISTSHSVNGDNTEFRTPNLHILIDDRGVRCTAHSRHLLLEAAENVTSGVAEIARAPFVREPNPEMLGASLADVSVLIDRGIELNRRISHLHNNAENFSTGFLRLIQSEVHLGLQILAEYSYTLYGQRQLIPLEDQATEWNVNDRSLYELMGDLSMLSFDVHRIHNVQLWGLSLSVTASLLDGASGQFAAASNLLQEFGILTGIFQPKRFVLPGWLEGVDVLEYLFAREDDLSSEPMICFVLGKGSSMSLPTSRLDAACPDWRQQISL